MYSYYVNPNIYLTIKYLCVASGGGWNTDTNRFNDYTLMPEFQNNEVCSFDDMEKRIKFIVYEIVG